MDKAFLETVIVGEEVTITARFSCRRDLARFLSISDKLMELFAPDPTPLPSGDSPVRTSGD